MVVFVFCVKSPKKVSSGQIRVNILFSVTYLLIIFLTDKRVHSYTKIYSNASTYHVNILFSVTNLLIIFLAVKRVHSCTHSH